MLTMVNPARHARLRLRVAPRPSGWPAARGLTCAVRPGHAEGVGTKGVPRSFEPASGGSNKRLTKGRGGTSHCFITNYIAYDRIFLYDLSVS